MNKHPPEDAWSQSSRIIAGTSVSHQVFGAGVVEPDPEGLQLNHTGLTVYARFGEQIETLHLLDQGPGLLWEVDVKRCDVGGLDE